MFAQESVMDVQKMPTLAEKQEFWAEQLPNFEATYWLPSHFEYVIFDMEQGNYVIKDGLDPSFEDDAVEIWHRVNTGWAMWKKAINFGRKQAQAVPEGFVILKASDVREILSNASDAMDAESPSSVFTQTGIPSTWYDHHLVAEKNILDAIKAQEPTND